MRENAVSPVIGVLLMLTLTLIMAAIVNSYAGGLVDTEPKVPTATLQVTYSQSDGMEIRHVSGDPIPTSSVKIFVRPSDSFGSKYSQYSSEVEKKYITDIDGSSWASGITSLRPGEVSYISNSSPNKNLTYLQKDIPNSDYWFNRSDNWGKPFFFELYYKNTMINRNEVLIEE